MTRSGFLLSVACALVLTGCDKAGGGGDRVAELEKQVTQLQDRDRDLRTKMAAREAAGQWGWNSFLAEPEFWQCTYDSAWAECSNRCSKDYVATNKVCVKKQDPAERDRCMKENSQRLATCVQACPRPTETSGVSSCFM